MRHDYNQHHIVFRHLLFQRALFQAGFDLLSIFSIIFVYEKLNASLFLLFLFLATHYFIKIPITYLSNNIASKLGSRLTMRAGMVFMTAHASCLLILAYFDGAVVIPTLLVAYLFLALAGAFYWPSYHEELRLLRDPGSVGSQISIMGVMVRCVGVIVPIIAAFIVNYYSFVLLFGITVATFLISMIPIGSLPDTRPPKHIHFIKSIRLLSGNHPTKRIFAVAGVGFQSLIALFFWPIFLYLVFNGNYLDIGLFYAIILLIQIIFELLLGRALNDGGEDSVLKRSGVIGAVTWISRAIFITPIGAFITSVIHSFVQISNSDSMDASLYKMPLSAQQFYRLVTAKSMVVNISKGFAGLLCAITTLAFPAQYVFVLASIGSLLTVLWGRD